MKRIPKHWAPDEALKFVGFLEQIIDDIWRAHGDEMCRYAEEYSTWPAHGPRGAVPVGRRKRSPEDGPDDDIPF